MFKALLYKLAYPLFAKEVEAYHRLNNAILGIHRWCASDPKADLITTHLLKVRDDEFTHWDDTFRERLRAIDKPTVVVTRVSVPECRSGGVKDYQKENRTGGQISEGRAVVLRAEARQKDEDPSIFAVLHQAHQNSIATAIADDDNFRKGCGSHEAAWSGSDDSCSSSSASSSGD